MTYLLTAQSVQVYKVSLDESKIAKSHFKKSKYYLKSFTNKGETSNKDLEETVDKYLRKLNSKVSKDALWLNKPWIVPVESDSEADIILSGEYLYTSNSTVGEMVYKEKTGNPKLPYFVTNTENVVDLKIVFTFEYKDGSPTQTDTINIVKKSIKAPGKPFIPLGELEEKVTNHSNSKLHYYTSIRSGKKVALNFPKVKIKDKALKTEYASIKKLYKEGEYIEAGKVVKKVYEAQKTPELAHALGICYELIGNYPKAAEYYKIKTDFHANVRMKQNMALLDYVKSLGYEPEFKEL